MMALDQYYLAIKKIDTSFGSLLSLVSVFCFLLAWLSLETLSTLQSYNTDAAYSELEFIQNTLLWRSVQEFFFSILTAAGSTWY